MMYMTESTSLTFFASFATAVIGPETLCKSTENYRLKPYSTGVYEYIGGNARRATQKDTFEFNYT
jgi:hypothetical protein